MISEMFSISEVDVTNDLKHAKVYVSVFSADKEKSQATFEAICDSAKAVRTELSKTMHIRTVPELHFVLDNSSEYGSTITYVTKPDDDTEEEADNEDDNA